MKISKAVVGAALAIASAGPAFGQDSGWYAGGAIGQSSVDSFCDGAAIAGVSCDDGDTTWKLFGGFQVNRNVAVELGYADLGEVSARGPGGTVSAEASAFEIVALGMLPLAQNFSLYGKAGLYRAEVDWRANTLILTDSSSDSNVDLTFGFGLKVDLARNVALRAEWQRYADVEAGGSGADLDVISLGVAVRF